jgi:hypothetical protein
LTREYLPAIKRAFFRLYCVKPLYGKSMATSSSPRNIAASRTLQAVRAAVVGGGVLPASYQLSAGNFSARNVDPILVYPRPDAETAAWTKHRRHYPGIGYRVPIGVAFGSGPLVYELIAGPAGASIGEFLVVSGDTLVVNDDYGVLTWANPTTGNHSFHVRVSFQDGFPPLDVYWTLEVTTTGTIFINAVNGSDSTGDGSLGNPFQTINAWWKDSLMDVTYSGFQVCYRGGEHSLSANNSLSGVEAGNWQMNGTDKPLVHYPYAGETVVLDVSNTTIVFGQSGGVVGGPGGSDCYFGQFEYNGVRNTDNARTFAFFGSASLQTYSAGGNDQRMTWDSPWHKNFINPNTSANNSAPCWMAAAGVSNRRHFIYVHRPTFENCFTSTTAAFADSTNFNGYYLGSTKSLLADHVTCINTEFGKAPIEVKGGCELWCIRFVDMVQAPKQKFAASISGSYMPDNSGPWEMSYAKILVNTSVANDSAIFVNQPFSVFDSQVNDNPVYINRSTVSRAPTNLGAVIVRNGWPTFFDGCLVVSDAPVSGASAAAEQVLSYTVANNPLDANLNLSGDQRTNQLGLFGAEIKAE